MEKISVHLAKSDQLEWKFFVTVGEGKKMTKHTVMLRTVDFDRLSINKESEEEFIIRCFTYLLAKESSGSIMKEFDIMTIAQYFPDFEHEIVL